MRLRNKSTTAFRDGKVSLMGKETVTVPDLHGRELLRLYPWHFEEVKDGGAASEMGSDSGAPEERTAPTPKHRRGR